MDDNLEILRIKELKKQTQLLERIASKEQSTEISIKDVATLKGEDGYTPVKGVDYFDGEDGTDYVLTDNDKKEIADSIEVPIVKKVIEKRTEVIREKPIITEIVKEIAITDKPEVTVEKLNTLENVLEAKVIKNYESSKDIIAKIKKEKSLDIKDINMSDMRWHGGGGKANNVTATLPITSTGGVDPNISSTLIQNRLLGRGSASGTGVFEAITLGTNLSLTGTTLNASGGSFTRTDVATTGTINNRAYSSWLNFTGSSGTILLTGVVAQTDGTPLIVTNDSASFLSIANQNSSSSAANRFITPGSVSIKIYAGQSASFAYDTTAARWRFTGMVNTSAGATGSVQLADGNGNVISDANIVFNQSSERLDVTNVFVTNELDAALFRLLNATLGDGGLLYTKTVGSVPSYIGESDPASLYYDSTTGNTGLGTTSPAYRLTSISKPNTLANPSAFSVTLTPESLQSPPGDSLTLLYGPQDNGGDNGSVETGGSGYTNNDNVSAQLFSYVNVGGANYTSPSGVSLTSISLSSNPAAIQWNWLSETLGDGAPVSGYIIVITDSTTSTTYSYDVGNTTNYFDNNVGGTVSYTTFSGFTASGQSFTYDLYAKGTSPGGALYFNDNGGTNTFNITEGQNNGTQFWVSHTISGSGGGNWRELDGTAGFDGTGDQMFYQTSVYGGTPTVTPTRYGIQSDGMTLNRDFTEYSFNNTIYSSGFLTGSTVDPNDGNYYYFAFTATTPTSNQKVTMIINGGGPTFGQIYTGTSFGLDALAPPFADGATIVPTSTPNIDAWFENNSTTKTVPVAVLNAQDAAGIPALSFRRNGTELTNLYSSGSNTLVTDHAFQAASFGGDGSNITGLNAGNVSTGTLAVARGGTNIASYAVGDILYASASTTLSKLADIATGNALISGGVTTAPSWGKIGLTTHVSGTLPVANGGTGVTSAAALTKTDDTNVTLTLGGAPTTALLTATSLTLGWTGTLSVARGGTGSSTLVGAGISSIVGKVRVTGQTAATSLTAYTVGAADSSFLISANVLITASTLHSFSATCSYTDESNTARVLTLNFSQLTGAFVTTLTNALGASAYEGVPVHIRCKASTTITLATTGTFTTVTYNFEEMIQQIS